MPRPRIVNLLGASLDAGIALVIAPPGFGKTEAVRSALGAGASYLSHAEHPTVEAVARGLIAGTAPGESRSLALLLQRDGGPQMHQELAAWVAARLRNAPRPIVLDDFHHVARDGNVLHFVRTLIEATVPATRWAIVSREMPQLPVGTWIARGRMNLPLTSAELQFTDDEARELANALDVTIDAANLAAIRADTQGWPVALRLALSGWERTRALPPLRLRTRGVLFDYLDAEVWQQTAAADRALLQLAALLVPVGPEVIEAAGFADAPRTLERLARENPFLQPESGGTYRLHELFREFLAQDQRRDRAFLAAIVRRTADGLEQLGFAAEALRLLTSLGLEDRVLDVLGRAGFALIDGGHRDDVVAAMRAFAAGRRNAPVLAALRGYLFKLDGSIENAEAEMAGALAGDLPPAARIETAHRLGKILNNRGRPAEAIAVFTPVLETLPEHSPLTAELRATVAGSYALVGDADQARALLHAACAVLDALDAEARCRTLQQTAFAQFHCGDLAEAETTAERCVELAGALGLDQVAAFAYSILVTLASMLHADTRRAAEFAAAMARLGERCGDKVLQAHGLRAAWAFAADRGDDDALGDAERRLAGIGQIRAFRETLPFRIAAARHLVGTDRLAEAVRTLASFDASGLSRSEAALRDSFAGLLLAAGEDHAGAAALLGRPLIVSAEVDRVNRRAFILAQAHRSLGHWLLGRPLASRRRIDFGDDALYERDRLLIGVILSLCAMPIGGMTGRQVDQLTEPLLAIEMAGHVRFLRKLVAPRLRAVRLTPAELAVLRAFRSGDTESAVASRLGKSPHTVHGHLKGIFRKFGCRSRAEAIDCATRAGLLEA